MAVRKRLDELIGPHWMWKNGHFRSTITTWENIMVSQHTATLLLTTATFKPPDGWFSNQSLSLSYKQVLQPNENRRFLGWTNTLLLLGPSTPSYHFLHFSVSWKTWQQTPRWKTAIYPHVVSNDTNVNKLAVTTLFFCGGLALFNASAHLSACKCSTETSSADSILCHRSFLGFVAPKMIKTTLKVIPVIGFCVCLCHCSGDVDSVCTLQPVLLILLPRIITQNS